MNKKKRGVLFSVSVLFAAFFFAAAAAGIARVIFFTAGGSLPLPFQKKEPVELFPPIRIEHPAVGALPPAFYENTADKDALKKTQTFFEYDGLHFALIDDLYRLECSGMLERLDPDYDGKEYPQSSWIYEGNYPIITPPLLFADALVFIDAEPSLFVLDPRSGALKGRYASPVFPAPYGAYSVCRREPECASFIFLGGDDNLYEVCFSSAVPDGNITHGILVHNDVTNNSLTHSGEPVLDILKNTDLSVFAGSENSETFGFKRLFSPDETEAAVMREKILVWFNMSEDFELPPPALIFESGKNFPFTAVQLKNGALFFGIFTPDIQGVYTAGLYDEKEKRIVQPGFTAVFGAAGELLGVSLDYVADKPQVDLHLSDTQVYYIAAGLFDQSDKTAGAEKNQQNTENGQHTASSVFVAVKKQ